AITLTLIKSLTRRLFQRQGFTDDRVSVQSENFEELAEKNRRISVKPAFARHDVLIIMNP
ncbi:MAG: hypothetical protein QOH96_4018, partial [Blastocatellia bacterium]|nr:hypothetical protein [Blastocatellia bacterium]